MQSVPSACAQSICFLTTSMAAVLSSAARLCSQRFQAPTLATSSPISSIMRRRASSSASLVCIFNEPAVLKTGSTPS